jgi:hypothetical protein
MKLAGKKTIKKEFKIKKIVIKIMRTKFDLKIK